MTATTKQKRPRKTTDKSAGRTTVPKTKHPSILNTTWPKGEPLPTVKIDMSRREAFLRLPIEERERRIEAFRKALAPAFANYSSEDFRRDQREEAERDS